MKKKNLVEVSETFAVFDDPMMREFRVRIDVTTLEQNKPELLFAAIFDAVAAHVKEKYAEDLYRQVQTAVISRLGEEIAKKIGPGILEKLSVEAIARVAHIHAGKALGKEIVE